VWSLSAQLRILGTVSILLQQVLPPNYSSANMVSSRMLVRALEVFQISNKGQSLRLIEYRTLGNCVTHYRDLCKSTRSSMFIKSVTRTTIGRFNTWGTATTTGGNRLCRTGLKNRIKSPLKRWAYGHGERPDAHIFEGCYLFLPERGDDHTLNGLLSGRHKLFIVLKTPKWKT
jgi:hypothetical protein